MSDTVVIRDDTPTPVYIFGGGGAQGAAAALASAQAADASAQTAQDAATSASISAFAADVAASNAESAETGSGTSATAAQAAEAAVLAALSGTSLASANIACADRTILAAANHSAGLPAILTEIGRFGVFAWSGANHSTDVTNDPQQGLFVAPSSNPTGASGAWVRQFQGRAFSSWFGVLPTESAANNTTRFNAALATLKATSTLVSAGVYYGYNAGSIGLHTPAGHYLFNGTLAPHHQLEISGDYTGSGGGTVFEWSSNTHGFTALGGAGEANGAVIRGLYMKGTNAGTACHAVNQSGNLTVDTCFFENWSGDGLHADSTSGGLSGSTWRNLSGQNIGWTLSIDGADSNGCTIENVGAVDNRFGGVRDSSGIGNVSGGGVVNRCGLISGFPTRSENNGHIFTVAPGQELWCSTNSPPTTATSNQGWWYFGEGSSSATQPHWTTGQTWYFSAPLYVEATDGNIRTLFVGPYVETGLNPIVLNDPSLIVGGQILVPVLNQFGTKHGGYIRADRYYTLFSNGIKTNGDVTIPSGSGFVVNNNKIIGDRDTGWAPDTGTAKKTSNTTYTGGTASATYSQAEITTLRNTVQDISQTVAAIKNALINSHGLFGT